MGFEEAVKILEQYDEGTTPRTVASLSCGCEGCGTETMESCKHRAVLEIRDLHVTIHGKEVLNGISLTIKQGEVHVLMGPNGAGKSSLAATIAGHPAYKVTKGSITLNGKDILALSPSERSKQGIFLAFQQPQEINVNLGTFLFHAFKARCGKEATVATFNKALDNSLKTLKLDRSFIDRQLNVGFSGGEKKRLEMLQLLLLRPAFAIFDETDAGLDIDSLKIVRDAFNSVRGPCLGVLLVTHVPKVALKAEPDRVHVIIDGAIKQSGNSSVIAELEKKGYGWLKPRLKVV
jgi:Fe-S cluster assembly ATP-binding protein